MAQMMKAALNFTEKWLSKNKYGSRDVGQGHSVRLWIVGECKQ
jgi:hypothetical protein